MFQKLEGKGSTQVYCEVRYNPSCTVMFFNAFFYQNTRAYVWFFQGKNKIVQESFRLRFVNFIRAHHA